MRYARPAMCISRPPGPERRGSCSLLLLLLFGNPRDSRAARSRPARAKFALARHPIVDNICVCRSSFNDERKRKRERERGGGRERRDRRQFSLVAVVSAARDYLFSRSTPPGGFIYLRSLFVRRDTRVARRDKIDVRDTKRRNK